MRPPPVLSNTASQFFMKNGRHSLIDAGRLIPSGQVEEVRKQLQARKRYEQELKTCRARIRYLAKFLPHRE
jgi:hypothetical protein